MLFLKDDDDLIWITAALHHVSGDRVWYKHATFGLSWEIHERIFKRKYKRERPFF